MAKGKPKLTDAKQRRANRVRVRIVTMELKTIIPLMEADMDQETRDDVSKTLTNCIERLTRVAAYYSAKPKQKETNAEETTNA